MHVLKSGWMSTTVQKGMLSVQSSCPSVAGLFRCEIRLILQVILLCSGSFQMIFEYRTHTINRHCSGDSVVIDHYFILPYYLYVVECCFVSHQLVIRLSRDGFGVIFGKCWRRGLKINAVSLVAYVGCHGTDLSYSSVYSLCGAS